MNEPSSLYERVGRRAGLQKLLHSFYADARQHAVLGPVFQEHVQDWHRHMEVVLEFWIRMLGGPSFYAGGFVFRHMSLGLKETHFEQWLDLWKFNCERLLPAAEAAEMTALARQVAASLKSKVIDDSKTPA